MIIDELEDDWEIKWVAEANKWAGTMTVGGSTITVEGRTRKETMQTLYEAIRLPKIKNALTSDQR